MGFDSKRGIDQNRFLRTNLHISAAYKSRDKWRESTMLDVFIIHYFVENYMDHPKKNIAAAVMTQ